MDPITLGLLAGGGLGLLQGQNNEKKMYQDMMLKSEMAKYAPYSEMAQSVASAPSKDLPDQSASLFSGMATGASAGSLFGKAGAGTDTLSKLKKWSQMPTDGLSEEEMQQMAALQKQQVTA